MRATVSGANRGRPQHAQRGMVTVVVMLFLIATVVFALSQMLNVSSGNVIDGQRQGDSTAAFFLAESGIEKAHASLNGTLLLGNLTDAACTGTASTYNLGRGSVTLSAASDPPTCDNNGGTHCDKCVVTSSAQVGFSNRTLTQDVALVPTSGVSCNAANADCDNSPLAWR
jgi:Tfp pilus assembly protein PilX